MLLSTIASRKQSSSSEKPEANQSHDIQSASKEKQNLALALDAQLIDIQKLLEIISKLDFNTVNNANPQNHEVLDILQRLFPEIPRDKLIQIEADISARLVQKPPSDTNDFYVKLSLSIAATIASFYFGGTLAAKGSDLLITKIYTILFGVPNQNSIAYSLLVPAKKFVISLAREYGGYAMGIVAGPTAYNLSGIGIFLCKKVSFLTSLLAKKPQLHLAMSLKDPSTFANLSIDEVIADFEMMALNEAPSPKEEAKEPEEVILGGQPCVICHNYHAKQGTVPPIREEVESSTTQPKTTMKSANLA